MKRIQVVCGGCGIEYKDEHGNLRHMLKTSEDGPFECGEEAALRLVSLGVAVYAAKEHAVARKSVAGAMLPLIPGPLPEAPDRDPEEESLRRGVPEEAQLRAMKVRELESLAGSMGLDTKDCVRKEDYIALIMETEPEDEDLEADEEKPPSLGGADPV